jgi:hypothetical protein
MVSTNPVAAMDQYCEILNADKGEELSNDGSVK